MSLIGENFAFRFDERKIVYWQGISSFSTLLNAFISGKKRGEGLKIGNRGWCRIIRDNSSIITMDAFQDWLRPELVWFLIGLVLLLVEFAAPGLVIFFFGLGAWLVALVCFVVDIGINVQLILFLVSSFLFLVLLRRKLRTFFEGKRSGFENLDDRLDEYVGRKVSVVKAIVPNVAGKVEFHGTDWEAEADEDIPEGTVVEIVEKNNITFKVKPIA